MCEAVVKGGETGGGELLFYSPCAAQTSQGGDANRAGSCASGARKLMHAQEERSTSRVTSAVNFRSTRYSQFHGQDYKPLQLQDNVHSTVEAVEVLSGSAKGIGQNFWGSRERTCRPQHPTNEIYFLRISLCPSYLSYLFRPSWIYEHDLVPLRSSLYLASDQTKASRMPCISMTDELTLIEYLCHTTTSSLGWSHIVVE